MATADAITDLYITSEQGRSKTAAAVQPARGAKTKASVQAKHVKNHIRDARRHAHPGPSGERNSHIAALLASPRGLAVLTRWASVWANHDLPEDFTKPWLQAMAIGGDKGKGKARPIAFEETLLKLASSATIRSQLPAVCGAAGTNQ